MDNAKIQKITNKLLQDTDDNIIGVGYGYKMVNGELTSELCLRFSVKEKKSLESMSVNEMIPKTMSFDGEEIKTDVIEGKIIPYCDCNHPDFYDWMPNNYSTINHMQTRPLVGGLSLTNYTKLSGYVGTMGFIAVDNDTGALVGVTNNHVIIDDPFIANQRTNLNTITNVRNDIIIQPSNGSLISSDIGRVKKYFPFDTASINNLDVATIALDSTNIDIAHSWKYVGLNTITTPLPFATTGEINDLLLQRGNLFSTGYRTGPKGEGSMKLLMNSTTESLVIDDYKKQGVNQDTYFSNVISFVATECPLADPVYVCPSPIEAGDSGSVLIGDIQGTKKIIGIVFAGQQADFNGQIATLFGYAARIDEIATQLNISAWDGTVPEYSDLNNIEECHVQGLDNRPFIMKDGKKFWQVGLIESNNICNPD